VLRTNTEKSKDKAVSHAKDAGAHAAAAGEKAGETVLNAASSLMHAVSEAVAPRAEAAATLTRDRTQHAREVAAEKAVHARAAAVSGVDRGIDTAVPRAQESLAHLGPKVDHARDSIVDDLLPKLQELIGSVQVAKDDILSRQEGPIAAVTGSPKKKSRKGGVLLTFGVLAAVGAAVAYYLSQKQDEDVTDPWAGTVDRPVGGSPGVDTQVREDVAPGAAAPEVAAPAPGAGVQAASVEPVEDDVPGTDPDARTGFGTDFGEGEAEEHKPQA
jgi:hypothetical protein